LIKITELRANLTKMPASFHDQDICSGLKQKRRLSAFIDGLIFKKLKGIKRISITYIFCSDEALLEMNRNFLKHDTYTDIITFDLGENETEVLGEIYISTDRVKDNAVKFGKEYLDELHRVIFHGALHLCGYKDKNKNDKEEMRRQEDKCLRQYQKELNANRKAI
jgi:probable rRNA maturation factor